MVMQQQRERQKRNLMDEYNRLKFLKKVGQNTYNNARNLYENRNNLTFGKPIQPNTLTSNASTNTIANYASPNMQATPSITNPATTNLATEFGGATTPTLSNATTGTTLANFGTQGSTALNGGALASSSPLTTAIASEASGAGLGSAGAGLGALGTEAATTAGAGTLAGTGAATAGTGAALGGAGAAGAAGAGAGTAALGALGPIGAILAGGALIYNMINGAKKKKDYEAMQIAQKATQQNEQLAQEGTNQAMQNLANDAQQNRQNANQGLVGDLYNSVTNPALKDMALNNLTNPQPVEQVPVKGSAASPIIEETPMQTGAIQTDVPATDTVQTGADNSGLINNLMGFFSDAGKGFQENNSTRLSPENFGQDTYTTQERGFMPTNQEVNAYADELRKNNVKDDVINAFLTEGKNSGNKDIAEWVDAHRDQMDENGKWKPTETVQDVEHKKGLAYRIGEGLGTANRILSNPITQGLIATGAYMADGSSPMYALGKGVEYGSNKARSDAYRRMVTGDDSASIFGGYSEKDLNAMSNQEYKRIMGDVAKQRVNETIRHNGVTEGQKDTQIKNQYELGKERNAIAWKNSQTTAARLNEAIRHNRVSEYLRQQGGGKNNGIDINEFNSNLAKYANYISNPNISEEDFKKARETMIRGYGQKFLSIESKIGGAK